MKKKPASPKKKTVTQTKTLVIAEKPSVAQDIVNSLPGKFQKSKTHFENDTYVVSYAIGHLVTICSPPEIDTNLKAWTLDNLPISPESFPLKSLKNSRSQLSALSKLIKRRDITEIINACDAGREGELIFRYILQFVSGKKVLKKTIKRLWLQSMTKSAIVKGFKDLKTDEEMKNLEAAAICRSESDWLIGINGSRALTSYKSRFGGFRLTPCGRVQTPTLTIILDRENEIKNFKPQKYWEIQGKFVSDGKDYWGKWIDPKFRKDAQNPHGRQDRIWKKSTADAIIKKCEGKDAEVTETSKPSIQNSPPLYDLTTLQREANNRFGLSAKATLDITQALYDRHKAVTYPRTGSRHLPENYLKTVTNVTKGLKKSEFGTFATKLLEKKWLKLTKKVFDDTKITDHHAIIPTITKVSGLKEVEQKIYNMITQRFLAVFYPPARYLNTTRISKVMEETFKTEGKVVKDPGWKEIYGIDAKSESVIIPLQADAIVNLNQTVLKAEATKPPPRYTESTLLSIMESAGKLVEDEELRMALKERGLGTPATRAAIIEGLLKDKYLVRQGKELLPSAKASELIETLSAMKIEELTSPEMTGEWEYRLEQMAQGQWSRDKFMQEIRELSKSIVKAVKSFDEGAKANKKELFKDAGTGKTFFETLTFYESEDGEIKIRKFLGGRHISEKEVQKLLSERKLGPMPGFISKGGKPFSALIKLNDQNKIEFVFEDPLSTAPDFTKLPVLGISPIDGSKVYESEMSYVSETAFKKDCKTGLKISKVILGKEIGTENIVRMLNGKKTNLIQRFQSSKTKRFFDAYLSLPKSGKISFSFPPRGTKKK
jgi:DNA topoisomerase-3